MNETIPELRISETTDGLIELEQQNGYDEPDRVTVHPLHLRFIAERMGLVPTADPAALATIAKLKRRLRLLRDRCHHLGEFLALYSDTAHADLEYEQNYSEATVDIADEFCADLDEAPCNATPRQETPALKTQTKPSANPAGFIAQLELQA